jgi:hypothetical protein
MEDSDFSSAHTPNIASWLIGKGNLRCTQIVADGNPVQCELAGVGTGWIIVACRT